MRHQYAVWKWAADCLQQQSGLVILYVTESSGSSPGRRGFVMAVNAAGELKGSIGGGIMEHKFAELARKRLTRADGPTLYRQVHDKSAAANQSGMICSGSQTICLSFLQPQHLPAIQSLLNAIDTQLTGTMTLLPGDLAFEPGTAKNTGLTKESDYSWKYCEVVEPESRLYIIGSGHCALALSQVMERLAFTQFLFDDRPGLATFMANTFVNEKAVIEGYAEIASLIEPGPNSFITIMTQGYRTDYLALQALLPLQVKYLGVLGSKRKIEKMFADLVAEGTSPQELKKIYAPIGLAIHSQTPEEIAVSIAAQIIQVRNSSR